MAQPERATRAGPPATTHTHPWEREDHTMSEQTVKSAFTVERQWFVTGNDNSL